MKNRVSDFPGHGERIKNTDPAPHYAQRKSVAWATGQKGKRTREDRGHYHHGRGEDTSRRLYARSGHALT